MRTMTPLQFYYLRYLALNDKDKLCRLLKEWTIIANVRGLNIERAMLPYLGEYNNPFRISSMDDFLRRNIHGAWCSHWIELLERERELSS
jgi:hypothetical protein